VEPQVSVDQILDLERRYLYDYIQDNIFLGQSNPNCFLIKMFTYGFANGVDIVRHM
jgi:hypothetical protein